MVPLTEIIIGLKVSHRSQKPGVLEVWQRRLVVRVIVLWIVFSPPVGDRTPRYVVRVRGLGRVGTTLGDVARPVVPMPMALVSAMMVVNTERRNGVCVGYAFVRVVLAWFRNTIWDFLVFLHPGVLGEWTGTLWIVVVSF